MSRSITNARHQAFINQSHHCFYCCVPIWENSPVEFIFKHQVTQSEAELLRCIVDHSGRWGEAWAALLPACPLKLTT